MGSRSTPGRGAFRLQIGGDTHQPFFDSETGKLPYAMQPKLAHQTSAMEFYSLRTDAELVGNLLVLAPLRNALQNLPLTPSEFHA